MALALCLLAAHSLIYPDDQILTIGFKILVQASLVTWEVGMNAGGYF